MVLPLSCDIIVGSFRWNSMQIAILSACLEIVFTSFDHVPSWSIAALKRCPELGPLLGELRTLDHKNQTLAAGA